jgi:hypothetical protein
MPATFASAGSLFDKQSGRIQEILNKNIEMFLPALDPAWRDTFVTSQGVGPSSMIGRDLKILKIYMGSMAGVLDMADSRDNFVLYGDKTVDNQGPKLQRQNNTNAWPDATDGVMARPYRLGVGMKAMVSNLYMSLGEMTAEATPAFIGEVIGPKLEGHARLMAHTLCNYWYIAENDNYLLSTIQGDNTTTLASSTWNYATDFFSNATPTWTAFSGTSAITGIRALRFNVPERSIDRYAVGMRVDVFDVSSPQIRLNDTQAAAANQTPSTRVSAWVAAVDEVLNRVVIAFGAGVSITPSATASSNTKYVYFANGRSLNNGGPSSGGTAPRGYGFAGVNSWLKNSGFLLGGDSDDNNRIDVDVHPEFKSFFKSSVGVLTEHKMRQYLRGYHRAKEKYGQYIDCLIASDGVWLNYEAQKIGQYSLDRTGKLSSLNSEGSQEGFKFTFDGRTYMGYTSNYIEDGTVYGIRKGGQNWKKYVPPSPKGTQKFDKAEGFIPFEFVGPSLGYADVKVPIQKVSGSSTLVTEGMQMPGMLRMQLVPDQPSGIKLTGVTTDRQYGD